MAQTQAATYLERLQKERFAVTGADPYPDYLSHDTGAKLDAVRAEWGPDPRFADPMALRREFESKLKRALVERPTRFEDPIWFLELQGLREELEDTVRTEGHGQDLALQSGWPLFGTLPIGRFNAMAIEVPGTDEHIIVFQVGVFSFTYTLTKAVAAVIPLRQKRSGDSGFGTNLKKVTKALRRDSEPLVRFADALRAYIVDGNAFGAEKYFLKPPASGLATFLRRSSLLFVLGHEYGHLLAGHLSRPDVERRRLGSVNVEMASRSHEQELSADFEGTALTIATIARYGFDWTLAYGAIELLFSCMDIGDRALAVFADTGERGANSDSHPSTVVRREFLRKQIADRPGGAAAIALSVFLQQVIDLMWERVEPTLRELHARGAVPSAIWAT